MAKRGIKKEWTGVVTSTACDKTVTVVVERVYPHPVYHKIVRRSKKYLAHDEKNECQVGDQVRILGTRPLSKRKRWRVVEILRRERRLEDQEVGPGVK